MKVQRLQAHYSLLWSLLMALTWLLPNHTLPWLAFHADAWCALVLLAMAAIVFMQVQGAGLHWFTVVITVVAMTPMVQSTAGVIVEPGIAWTTSAYMLGLVLAIIAGASAESNTPGRLCDRLFVAIIIAGVLSAVLQIAQKWATGELGLFLLGPDPWRPSGNLGQSNQLATLQLWGVIACMWCAVRKQIEERYAICICALLLIGIALTGSRAAAIGVMLIIAAIWYWRRLWPNPKTPWLALIAGVYFNGLVFINSMLMPKSGTITSTWGALNLEQISRINGEPRFVVWPMFAKALLLQPWSGFGWGQITFAQLAVANESPNLNVLYSYSHNLALDLMLWIGLPLGAAVTAALAYWMWSRARAIQSAENVVLWMILLVVANHAMLELPLYYGYFLWPAGIIVGTLDARLSSDTGVVIPRSILLTMTLVSALLLTVIASDYLKVESSYRDLRLEWIKAEHQMPVAIPEIRVLTQWRNILEYSRLHPQKHMTESQLSKLRETAKLHPSPAAFENLAISLAINDQPLEASYWLKTMCKVVPTEQCEIVKKNWTWQGSRNPEIARIPWPVKP